MYRMIWPEKRNVTEKQVKTWYEDAIANQDVDNPNLTNPDDMVKELNSIGNVTISLR